MAFAVVVIVVVVFIFMSPYETYYSIAPPVCPSTVYEIRQKYFQNQFIFGKKGYWDISANAIKTISVTH